MVFSNSPTKSFFAGMGKTEFDHLSFNQGTIDSQFNSNEKLPDGDLEFEKRRSGDFEKKQSGEFAKIS